MCTKPFAQNGAYKTLVVVVVAAVVAAVVDPEIAQTEQCFRFASCTNTEQRKSRTYMTHIIATQAKGLTELYISNQRGFSADDGAQHQHNTSQTTTTTTNDGGRFCVRHLRTNGQLVRTFRNYIVNNVQHVRSHSGSPVAFRPGSYDKTYCRRCRCSPFASMRQVFSAIRTPAGGGITHKAGRCQ